MKTPNPALPSYFPTPKPADPGPLLTHPDNRRVIEGTLLAQGTRRQDLQDAVQDVYVKALTSFQRSPAPPDLERMKAFCALIARNHAIDELRKADFRKRDLVGTCDPDEYTPLEYGAAQRDPVDAGRQLEVLAQLFREGRMPEDGVEVLEGVASGCTHAQIAEDLGINVDLVMYRLRTMRKVFRARMVKLCMLPGMLPLRLIVSSPAAIDTLRLAA
jgi:RNA polymerase sigma factor (sigma-70 family)